MTDYKDSGVDIATGDAASASAYAHATSTFASREGLVGQPVVEENGYGGLLDMGDHYLVQSDDSTGSKIDIAFATGTLDTLGYDLTAMVADDVVCTGAEPLSLSNCLDVPKIQPEQVDALMSGLAQACSKQKIVIPAGEIAEVPGAVTHAVWSATLIGIVDKDKLIQPATIAEGDAIIALREPGLRSNGFSLVRKILYDAHGQDWHAAEWKDGTTWGQAVLAPSTIYAASILALIGRHGQDRTIDVKGIAHITGGGIPSKLGRILKHSGCGADLTDLWEPYNVLQDCIQLGAVPVEECYRTWNMGNGMMVVVSAADADRSVEILQNAGVDPKVCGTVSKESGIRLSAYTGDKVEFV